MQQNDRKDSTVIKDSSDYYNARLAQYQDNIDELRNILIGDKNAILYINNELHKIFIHISAKLTREEIITQRKYRILLNNLNPIRIRKKEDLAGVLISYSCITKDYDKYFMILEKIEIHINRCLERIGLTSKEQVKRTKLR